MELFTFEIRFQENHTDTFNETCVCGACLPCVCRGILGVWGFIGRVFILGMFSPLTCSGLLAAFIDLPPAGGSQGDEESQQTHCQTHSHPQSHRGEHHVLT